MQEPEPTLPPEFEESSETLSLPVELQGIELDPERATHLKAQRLYRLNAITIPALRFVGFGALSVGIYAYLHFFDHRPDAAQVALSYAALSLSYCVVAAIVLRTYRPHLSRLGRPSFVSRHLSHEKLSVGFLAGDVVFQTLAIYLTGGENSWLVALLLLRVADQATSGQRRALFFAHFNACCYLALTLYLGFGEGRELDWGRELTKFGLLLIAGWWITASAGGGDRRRRQVSAAIDGTRRLIRRLKRQAKRLDEAKVQAEAANQVKSQFLANMSHELRTPLSGVIGIAELLMDEPMRESQRYMVQQLLTSADSLLHIVDDILDFARIEAGKLTVEVQSCRLRKVVADVLQVLTHSAREQDVKLRQRVPPLPPVVTDPARLRQILLNLVGNAVKFSPHGSVEVVLSELARQDDQLRLRFEVRDSGIGISETDQADLFEPFTQVDVSSSRRFGGTGLGLAIVRSLVDLMGGQLGVSSQLGVGSVFWVELPMQLATDPHVESGSPTTEAATSPGERPPRVLLVEDNPVAAAVAEGTLQHLGAEVEIAGDGHQAVTAFRQSSFDLILMDCQMPNMDGFQATREIRRLEAEPGARRATIVALTAHALTDDRQRCLAAGMDDHLAKPVRRETLRQILASCCPESKLTAPPARP